MSDVMTDRQREVFEFIKSEIMTKGMPPTVREIGARIGVASTNAASDHLRALEKKGMIRRAHGRARMIVVVGGTDPAAEGMSTLQRSYAINYLVDGAEREDRDADQDARRARECGLATRLKYEGSARYHRLIAAAYRAAADELRAGGRT